MLDRPAIVRILGTAIMILGAGSAIVVTVATIILMRAERCSTPSQCEDWAVVTSLAKWPVGLGLLALGFGMFVRSFGQSEK